MKGRNPFWIIRKGLTFLVSASFLISVSIADAEPLGGVVSAGNATITQTADTTTINQSSQNAAINWQSFSIDFGEKVNFRQPNRNSITLNRVVGNEKSVINGALNANGQVFILNSNGVLFGKNASINTSGLVATTMSLTDKDFMDGKYSFNDASDASVINMGSITISDAGYAALLGSDVENSGTIQAVRGKIYMSGADSVTINLNGNSLVDLTVDKSVVDALVENSGAVIADGGEIYLTTSSAEDLVAGVVNNTGLVKASTMDDFTGDVIIFAHGGTANVGGTVTTGKGEGFVETSGAELNIAEGTKITTGDWLIDPTDVTIDGAMASALEGQLASGNADVTTSDGSITVDADITINTNTLKLDAAEDITVNSTINVNNTGGIDFEYGGDMAVTLGKGIVNLSDTSSLTINGTGYTIIKDYADWAAMSGALAGNYALGSNLDLTGVSYSYIGSSGSPFTGKMNGLGHTVSNLHVDTSDSNVGLFGSLEGAVVSNLFIDNAYVHSTGGWNVGALAGYAKNTYIYNIGADADVDGSTYTGGLLGEMDDGVSIAYSFSEGKVENTGASFMGMVGGLVGGITGSVGNVSIKNSYSTAEVTGHADQTGGLVGYAQLADISDSYATGDVHGTKYTGGLLGGVGEGSEIIGSYATGNVESTSTYTGGLAGVIQGTTVTNSYATGDVSSTSSAVGGLIGGATSEVNTISGSYATGSVSGNNYVGGIIGYFTEGSVSNSYATGNVKGVGTWAGGLIGGMTVSSVSNSYALGDVIGNQYVGSLAGKLEGGSITNSYAFGNVSGTSDVNGLVYFVSGTVTNSFYSSDANSGITAGANNVASTDDEILEAMYTAWDADKWTGANTNLGVPLLQWQDITDVALTVDGTYIYGTELSLADFLANASDYGTVEYILKDANGNDVTSEAAAGTLGAGTYTVSVLIDGEYTVTNTGTQIILGKKELGYTLDTDTVTYGDSYTFDIGYTGMVQGGAAVTGSVSFTVFDANGNDVTAQAEAGTLPAGEYTITATLTDANYTLGSEGYTMTVLADDSQESHTLIASITPAIMSNLASQPIIQLTEYTPSSAPEYTQKGGEDEDAGSGARAGAETGSGESGQLGYIGAGRGFTNNYSGLVEIVNGGIRMPE